MMDNHGGKIVELGVAGSIPVAHPIYSLSDANSIGKSFFVRSSAAQHFNALCLLHKGACRTPHGPTSNIHCVIHELRCTIFNLRKAKIESDIQGHRSLTSSGFFI